MAHTPEIQLGAYPLHPTVKPAYQFTGVAPHVDASAARLGVSQEMTGQAKLGWHPRAIQSALGSLCEITAKARAGHLPANAADGLLERIAAVRGSLAAQLAGIDAAIENVFTELGLPVPGAPALAPAPVPTQAPNPSVKPSRSAAAKQPSPSSAPPHPRD